MLASPMALTSLQPGLLALALSAGASTPSPKPAPKPTPSAAARQSAREERREKAQVAASYRVAVPTSRRLRFEPFGEGLPRSGQWRNGFAIADINGDGHLDIVHGPPRGRPGPPVIFLGDGRGRWRRWTGATFPAQPFDYGDTAVADFNGDGHLDIALGMHLLGVTVLLGDGAGRFTAAQEGMDPLHRGRAFSSRAVEAVDWDGDGRTDVVALGEGPRLMAAATGDPAATTSSSFGVRLYRNRGGATWEARDSGPDEGFGDTLAVGRLDGKRLGLVRGSSRMGANDILLLPGGDPWTVGSVPIVRPQGLVGGVAMADFDGDGADDLALGYRSYEAGAWHSGLDLAWRREGSWQRRPLFAETGPTDVPAAAAGDLDGDGRADLVAATGDGRILVFRNTGKGTFARETAVLSPAVPGCRGYHLEVKDLDGDGRGDIVASFAGEPQGLPPGQLPGCEGQGRLQAWRTIVRRPGSEKP